MRKIHLIGILAVLLGVSLVSYSVSASNEIILESEYLITRGILILGFVLMAGGGLIALSPFGRNQ